jgi:hypothetical protein
MHDTEGFFEVASSITDLYVTGVAVLITPSELSGQCRDFNTGVKDVFIVWYPCRRSSVFYLYTSKVRANSCEHLESVHQVPNTAGWPEAMWIPKLAQRFHIWPLTHRSAAWTSLPHTPWWEMSSDSLVFVIRLPALFWKRWIIHLMLVGNPLEYLQAIVAVHFWCNKNMD